jgi:hypothetical protein
MQRIVYVRPALNVKLEYYIHGSECSLIVLKVIFFNRILERLFMILGLFKLEKLLKLAARLQHTCFVTQAADTMMLGISTKEGIY